MTVGNPSHAEQAGATQIPRWSDLFGESKPAAKGAVQERGQDAAASSAAVDARRESGSTQTQVGRSAASTERSGGVQ